jgi:hypothetical protein
LLQQTGRVQMQFLRQIFGQKPGHTNLLDKTGGVQTQFLGEILGQKRGTLMA